MRYLGNNKSGTFQQTRPDAIYPLYAPRRPARTAGEYFPQLYDVVLPVAVTVAAKKTILIEPGIAVLPPAGAVVLATPHPRLAQANLTTAVVHPPDIDELAEQPVPLTVTVRNTTEADITLPKETPVIRVRCVKLVEDRLIFQRQPVAAPPITPGN